MADLKWTDRVVELRRIPASELKRHPANFRRHPKHQKDAMQAMLAEVGFAGAALAYTDTDGALVLIDGHLRAEVGGAQTIPVLVTNLTAAEAESLLLSYDALGAMAQIDKEALRGLAGRAQEDSRALAMLSPLQDLYRYLAATGRSGGDDEPDDPNGELQRKWATEVGQVWQVGGHRIGCGDSGDVDLLDRLLGQNAIDMVMTSPPYGSLRHYDGGFSGWMTVMESVFRNVLRRMRPLGHVLVNLGLQHNEGRVWEYYAGLHRFNEAQGWPLYGQYVWDQGFGLPGIYGSRLCPSFEFIFHYAVLKCREAYKTVESLSEPNTLSMRKTRGDKKDGSLHPKGVVVRHHTTKVADSVVRIRRSGGGGCDGEHPAVFPVALPEFLIPIWTQPQEIVVEPFCGSGTTLVACEHLGRRGVGIDLSPAYVAITLERLSKMGLEPKLVPHGD